MLFDQMTFSNGFTNDYVLGNYIYNSIPIPPGFASI